jgi:hypothetical protein
MRIITFTNVKGQHRTIILSFNDAMFLDSIVDMMLVRGWVLTHNSKEV